MDLFKQYLAEREGKQVLENKTGFIIYKLFEKECFIADMFILPENRSSQALSLFINELVGIAKKHGCECITANIHVADSANQKTLRAALKMGFNIFAANNNVIMISKDLG